MPQRSNMLDALILPAHQRYAGKTGCSSILPADPPVREDAGRFNRCMPPLELRCGDTMCL